MKLTNLTLVRKKNFQLETWKTDNFFIDIIDKN